MKQESLTVTASVGPNYFLGKICAKHPHEGGKRRKKTHGCIACEREYRKKSAKRPEAKEARKKALADRREHMKMNEELKLAIRRRAVDLYLKAGGDVKIASSMYGRYWNTARVQLIQEYRERRGNDVWCPLEETPTREDPLYDGPETPDLE